ncbi:flavin reductase family protein [Phreatobacter stygius]|uniref:Flavin reductase family protein n=1 Tax=Phreatobacter stygius TaxID=1940610 RepID=A0A4D7AYL8_9HYPH|nr:flavin reductase family protein [Phreatobacter stygius]QCI66594.1 flavin reductase family protein [Phreatobacter stygius]
MTRTMATQDAPGRPVADDPAFSHSLHPARPESAVGLAEFRAGMRALPGAVMVLTTADGGQRSGLTATAVCSLSAEPPRLLACVNKRGQTFQMMHRARRLAVNVLAEHHHALAECFAGFDRTVDDRFMLGRWREVELGRLPVLDDAVVAFECDIAEIICAVSHGLVIADITAIHVAADARPLLYADGRFAALADTFVDPRYGFQF